MTTLDQTGHARGVRMAVLSNRFEAVVRSMRNTLTRTSRSGVINTARDFSCAVVSQDFELLHWAESLPAHAVSGPDLMTRSMVELHQTLRRGDAFLHNSPYHGGGHAADHAILVPVIDEDGVHRFTVVAKAHQADCGNALPTTYSANARDVYEEGALIFPCVRVQNNYVDNDDVIRMCRMRIRVPDQWWGDYLALLGAARIGERRLLELGDELGWEALRTFSDEWLDYSEQRMAAAIRGLPSGEASVETAHDPIPAAPDGIPIRVTVRVRSEDAMIDIDLRDNLDCQPCGLNLTECMARAAAMIGIFNSVANDIPPNGGSARRVNVMLRENCVVGIPRHPASCSVATTNVFDRVANAVQRGLAEIGEGMGMAEVGVGIPPAVSVISGHDPRNGGAPFVNQLILAWTGGAGGQHSDGWLTTGGPGDGGALLRDSVEIDEMRQPIIIHAQHVVPDSEGSGRRRGAPGGFVEFGPKDTELEAIYLSDGTITPPRGAGGGGDGAAARQYRRGIDGSLTELDVIGHVKLAPGETILSYTTGGGGYGVPWEREAERVLHDVVEGWITPERAEHVYGVVVRHGELDIQATNALRARIAQDVTSTIAIADE
jgi:N-methylhydantoinase B